MAWAVEISKYKPHRWFRMPTKPEPEPELIDLTADTDEGGRGNKQSTSTVAYKKKMRRRRSTSSSNSESCNEESSEMTRSQAKMTKGQKRGYLIFTLHKCLEALKGYYVSVSIIRQMMIKIAETVQFDQVEPFLGRNYITRRFRKHVRFGYMIAPFDERMVFNTTRRGFMKQIRFSGHFFVPKHIYNQNPIYFNELREKSRENARFLKRLNKNKPRYYRKRRNGIVLPPCASLGTITKCKCRRTNTVAVPSTRFGRRCLLCRTFNTIEAQIRLTNVSHTTIKQKKKNPNCKCPPQETSSSPQLQKCLFCLTIHNLVENKALIRMERITTRENRDEHLPSSSKCTCPRHSQFLSPQERCSFCKNAYMGVMMKPRRLAMSIATYDEESETESGESEEEEETDLESEGEELVETDLESESESETDVQDASTGEVEVSTTDENEVSDTDTSSVEEIQAQSDRETIEEADPVSEAQTISQDEDSASTDEVEVIGMSSSSSSTLSLLDVTPCCVKLTRLSQAKIDAAKTPKPKAKERGQDSEKMQEFMRNLYVEERLRPTRSTPRVSTQWGPKKRVPKSSQKVPSEREKFKLPKIVQGRGKGKTQEEIMREMDERLASSKPERYVRRDVDDLLADTDFELDTDDEDVPSGQHVLYRKVRKVLTYKCNECGHDKASESSIWLDFCRRLGRTERRFYPPPDLPFYCGGVKYDPDQKPGPKPPEPVGEPAPIPASAVPCASTSSSTSTASTSTCSCTDQTDDVVEVEIVDLVE